MKSSLYVFIALGALLISHTSAAPTSGLPALGKELIKLLVSSNEQAEAETSSSVGNQVDALIQMTSDGVQAFIDGMNEALAEEQRSHGEGGHGGRGYSDSFETSDALAYITGFTWNMIKLLPKLGSGFFG